MITERAGNGKISVSLIIGLIIVLLIVVFMGIYFLRKGDREVYRPRRIAKRVKIEVPPPSLEADKGQKPLILSEVKRIEKEEALSGAAKIEEKSITEKEEIAVPAVVDRAKKEKPYIAKRAAKVTKNVVNRWVINVISTPSKGDAMLFLKRLERGGYNGYITEFEHKNKLWYRVRIGFFPSKKEAERVGKGLSAKYLAKSYWVVKASKKEITAHRNR